MNIQWSKEEEDFIRENASVLSDEKAASILQENSDRKITIHTYRKKRIRMGIKKGHGRGIVKVVE